MIALSPTAVNIPVRCTPIDQRSLPDINGSGLKITEWYVVNGCCNNAMADHAARFPEADGDAIEAVGRRAATEALKRVLRDRPRLAGTEPMGRDVAPADPPAPRRLSSLAQVNAFAAAVEADGAFHRALADRQPLPFVSTCHDVSISVCPYKISLEAFIAAEVADFDCEAAEHRALWCGGELLAVIRPGANGKPEVLRLDTLLDADAMVEGDPESWPEWTDTDVWELGPDPNDTPDFDPSPDDSEWLCLQEQANAWNLPALSGGAPDAPEPSDLDRWVDEAMPELAPDLSDDFGGAFGGAYASEGA